uniref:t-SNARE coiled-coil homology domain-containing protein n=1 Tax=Heterorhabditis bacteriophora TaxID=37862 RepID=A0A1I7XMA0_HETBA
MNNTYLYYHQNSDRLDLDVKNCSQSSLPDAFDFKPNPLRNTKSMSDLTMDVTEAKVSLSREESMVVDEVTTRQDNLTNRITEWLTRIEI